MTMTIRGAYNDMRVANNMSRLELGDGFES